MLDDTEKLSRVTQSRVNILVKSSIVFHDKQ